jgi:uncharacterized protein involved in exopolysaccharide biosynthesis
MQRKRAVSESGDIDIAAVGRSVLGGWRKLLLATALVGAATLLALSLATPRYVSEARIEIDNAVPESARSTPDRAESARPDREAVTTQVEVLKSRDLAARVVRQLKLDQNPEFNSALGLGRLLGLLGFGPSPNESEEQRVAGAFYKRLTVYSVKDSRIIVIGFGAADPVLAANGANTLADSYIEWQKAERVRQERGPAQVLGAEIPKLRAELGEAEVELERFRARTGNLKTAGDGATLNTQQLTDISTRLNEARSQRAEAEARARIVRSMLQAAGQADTSPDVMKSPVIQQLQLQKVRIDRQIAELSATLLPAHPRMLQLRSEQQGFARQIREEAGKIVLSLENEAKIAGAREASLQAELDRFASKADSGSGDLARLRELEAAVKSRREVLEGYEKRFREARTRDVPTAVPASAKVVSRAQPSSTPVFPKTGPLTAFAMAATFFGGLALLAIKAMLLGVPAAGAALSARSGGAGEPQMPGRRNSIPAAPEASAPAPRRRERLQPDEGMEPLARHLVARAGSAPGFRVLLSGEDDAQEAVHEAIELGRALTAAGRRVVLIDWSSTAKPITSLLAIPRTPGVRELIAGEATLEEALRTVDGSGLAAIAPGRPRTESESPEELEGIDLLFEALDGSFDMVLVTAEATVSRRLIGLVQGGFDAGILVGRSTSDGLPANGFLGLDVPGMEQLRFAPRIGPTPRGGAAELASVGH